MIISLVFHVGLLFVPLPPQDVTEEDAEDADFPEAEEEEEAVDILSLSDIATPEPPPEEPPQQQQQQAPPSGEIVPNLDPEQAGDPLAEPEIPVDDGSDQEAANAFIDQTRGQFVGDLSGLGVQQYTDIGPLKPNILRRPENASCFIDVSGNAVPNVRVVRLMDKEPSTLLRENFPDTYGSRGITFQKQADYCGEQYFYLFGPTGEFFMALSLAQGNGSTLLVAWETRPQ